MLVFSLILDDRSDDVISCLRDPFLPEDVTKHVDQLVRGCEGIHGEDRTVRQFSNDPSTSVQEVAQVRDPIG